MASDKIKVVIGSLLDAKENYICHQCNCVTTRSKGLSAQIFGKYPEVNTYASRYTRIPGTNSIHQVFDFGENQKWFVNMYAQYRPGKAKHDLYGTVYDSDLMRREWFQCCLSQLVENVPPGSTFAFPWGIGCGLAGGDWEQYYKMLEEFSQQESVGKVVLYKIE